LREKQFIFENNRLEIVKEYDCIIVGGGIAGVSAALAAARHGCRTLMIEKGIMLGGLATMGFVNKYLPLCDGKGQKVCAGISEELLRESIRYGYNSLAAEWETGELAGTGRSRYESVFSPYDLVLALDQLLVREKIDLVFDTLFAAPYLTNDVCAAIIVEDKSGRRAYQGQTFIDATGDADLMRRCGVDCEEPGNWLSYWAYVTSFESMAQAVKSGKILDGVNLWELGARFDGVGAADAAGYRLTGPEAITEFVMKGRQILRTKLDQAAGTGLTVAALPGMAQARTIRRIKGRIKLTVADLNRYREDSIGCAPDWRRRGEVYEIPFGCLVSDKVKNVITAGRCISATGDTWEVTRAIPACAVTGQAVGTAAALAKQSDCPVADLPVREVGRQLGADGAILHYFGIGNSRNQ
jgi:hypothetical protein